MVDPLQLANDIVQNDAFLLLPPLLWLFLYLFAWEKPALARAVGFGRVTFWLLLPGALLGTVANLPFFPWQGAILAINLGGGVLPLVLSGYVLSRALGDIPRATALLLVSFAAESGALLMVVLSLPVSISTTHASFAPLVMFPGLSLGAALLLGAAAAAPLMLLGLGAVEPGVFGRTLRRTGYLLGLVSAVLLSTFASTATIPGLGIVSSFPFYLLGPLLVGVAAPVLARSAFELPARSGLPIAYGATTFGVLVGADLLRQPPLYGHGAALYSIGGAGLFDLVYLSGLLSLLTAFLTYHLLFRRTDSGELEPAGTPTPFGRLRRSLALGLMGGADESVAEAARATQEAALQARTLLGVGLPVDPRRPWDGMPVPSWVPADQANLDALAESPRRDPRDAFRAWMTSRWLVRIAGELGRSRFGSLGTRSFAFLLDLLLLVLPAILVWVYLSRTLPGTTNDVLSSPIFNAAAAGFPAYGFGYFAVGEGFFGQTIGKRLFGLKVRDRALRSPGLISILVRNLPKLIPLTVLGLGGAVVSLVLIRGTGSVLAGVPGPVGGALAAVALAGFIGVGVGLSGAVSALSISGSSENQRIGDFFAGTWVVQPGPTVVPEGALRPAVPAPERSG